MSAHQPQYLPYLGYFDKAAAADVFVFMDLPQYKKREFQNRNRVKGPSGEIWLTVPVITKGKFDQPIREVEIDPTQDWQRSHWNTLELNYKKAPFWDWYAPEMKGFYEKKWTRLAELNIQMCLFFFKALGLTVPCKIESELGTTTQSTERLIEMCRKTGADTYLSGAGGKDYMDESRFKAENLGLKFQHYQHPAYRQQYPKTDFLPYMSIVDLLFNEGPESLGILRNPEVK